MKIYLDNNLGVSNVEQEELTQDTIGYNILKVYIPNAVLTPYNVFTCYYGALLQNGRKVGWFSMEARTSSDADYEANYTLYKATLEQCVVSVEGKVYIGCQVLLGNSGNATLIKKNTAVVQFNVRKSVAINNDILVLDTDQTTTDVLESYKNLLENALTTYATKATTYTKTEVNSALALKADKSDTYTKSEVYNKTETNALLDTKADKSTTYTKTEVDSATLNLATQIASNKVELQNEINSTNNNVITTIARVGALETDVADLKSVQNVVEVVATYSALQSYDTTKLGVNDKVQVIADESHDGASTIYNWNGSAWQYVGAFGGNSYTKAETYNKTQIDSALSDKADKSNTYTRTVIDSMILTLSTDKADKSDVYTKTEEDAKFEEVGQAFEIVGNEILKKADKTEVDQKINDLRWELGSHTLDVTTDTDVAFSKSVPSGTIGCQINKVGGMSYKSENLNVEDTIFKTQLSNASYSNGLVTTSSLSNYNTFGFNIAWANQFVVDTKNEKTLLKAGTYYLSFDSRLTELNDNVCNLNAGSNYIVGEKSNDGSRVIVEYNFIARRNINTATFSRTIISFTLSDDTYVGFLFQKSTSTNASRVEMQRFMIAKSNINYQPYFDGIRDSAVTSVVSKGSNDTTINTLTIPSEIQALTGYGWGIDNTCYNYIDFATKKFVQKVGRVDLGTLTWNYNVLGEPSYFYASIANAVNSINVSCYLYESAVVLSTNTEDKIICITQNQVRIRDNELEGSIVDLNTKLNGVYLYYERATPVETDISAYLTTDTIDVEPLGTLEFTNTYNQDVPSDIDYLIEEVKA